MAPRIIRLLIVLFCIAICNTITTDAQSTSCDIAPAQYQCVSDCTGKVDGNYQSCVSCNLYVSCIGGVIIYANRSCPGNLVWDQNTQNCEWTSSTCGGSVQNPDIARLGYPSSVTPGSDTSTPPGSLFLPNRNVTFPADGKLQNVTLYAISASTSEVKIASASVSSTTGGISYSINSVSVSYSVSAPGWNPTITFEKDGGYLPVTKDGAIAMVFDVTCTVPFKSSPIAPDVCTQAGTYNEGLVDYNTIGPGTIVTNMANNTQCRAYSYMAFYIPNDVCENICLPAVGSKALVAQQLYPSLTDSFCWNINAPSGIGVVIMVNITEKMLGAFAAVVFTDGNGSSIANVSQTTNLPYGALYSFTNSLVINLISPVDNSAAVIKFSAIVEAVLVSSIPPDYYEQINNTKDNDSRLPGWAIALIVILLLLLLLLLIIIILLIKKKNRTVVPAANSIVAEAGEKQATYSNFPPPYRELEEEYDHETEGPFPGSSVPPARTGWVDPSIERKT